MAISPWKKKLPISSWKKISLFYQGKNSNFSSIKIFCQFFLEKTFGNFSFEIFFSIFPWTKAFVNFFLEKNFICLFLGHKFLSIFPWKRNWKFSFFFLIFLFLNEIVSLYSYTVILFLEKKFSLDKNLS